MTEIKFKMSCPEEVKKNTPQRFTNSLALIPCSAWPIQFLDTEYADSQNNHYGFSHWFLHAPSYTAKWARRFMSQPLLLIGELQAWSVVEELVKGSRGRLVRGIPRDVSESDALAQMLLAAGPALPSPSPSDGITITPLCHRLFWHLGDRMAI